MPNIKLTIAYDGTDFHGWQIQPDNPTIQGAITTVLRQVTQESDLIIHGAGRTDAGVHAWGQVANFETHSELLPGDFLRALNALLPPAIRIRAAEEVSPEFHARWLAVAKTYRYRIFRGAVAPPFSWRYVLHDAHALDFSAMAEAARCFEGEHDFTSFAASTGTEEDDRERITIRTILASQLARCPANGGEDDRQSEAQEWVYEVRGRSFLRNMVRKMVGTLLEIGRGRLAPSDIAHILAARDRTRSGPTAPPQGLCLMSVEYPDPSNLGAQQP